jgi:hypothetical protein
MDRACNTYGGNEKCKQYFSPKTSNKEPLERPRHKWEDNIKTDLREAECEDVIWM